MFYRLDKLRQGARVEVTPGDSSIAVFAVTSVERFNKNRLPAERVYGEMRAVGLRLITCGGAWIGGSVGYADNVVAFAELVGSPAGAEILVTPRVGCGLVRCRSGPARPSRATKSSSRSTHQ